MMCWPREKPPDSSRSFVTGKYPWEMPEMKQTEKIVFKYKDNKLDSLVKHGLADGVYYASEKEPLSQMKGGQKYLPIFSISEKLFSFLAYSILALSFVLL